MYQCDIDGNLEAGERLAKVLQLGSSQKWPVAMKLMTGNEQMSAKAFIEYFEPLFHYIDLEVKNETLGWNSQGIGKL